MPIDSLRRRRSTLPAQPLFTHYDAASGSRIELSAVTFANWVDKTCNLLDDLGVDPGDRVRIDLAQTDPGHWVTSVWVVACWQRGCTVVADAAAEAALVVSGPEASAAAVQTVACSLHPLGLAFGVVPEGCIDYAEVLSQPDVHAAQQAPPAQLAWAPDITYGNLAAVTPRANRKLFLDPAPGWDTFADLLVAPLLGDGSTVVVTGGDDAFAERVRTDERAHP